MTNTEKPPILALLSGGRDSLIAAKYMEHLGFSLIPIHFRIGINDFDLAPELPPNVYAFRYQGIEHLLEMGYHVEVVNVVKEYYRDVIARIHQSYAQDSVCFDCKTFVLRQALIYADAHHIKHILTGEVPAQKAQEVREVLSVDEHLHANGRFIRPLFGGLLPKSQLEQEQFLDTQDLPTLYSESQLAAQASSLGIPENISSRKPCVLSEKQFANRVFDLLEHSDEDALYEFQLLKVGKHFRISPTCKLIIGRNLFENEYLQKFFERMVNERFALQSEDPIHFGILYGEESAIVLNKALGVFACFGNLETRIAISNASGETLGERLVPQDVQVCSLDNLSTMEVRG